MHAPSLAAPRHNPWTVAALGVLAAAGSDVVHELLGHGVAVLLSPSVRALSWSTVALQTTAMSRPVAAAGSIANVLAALLAAALLRRRAFGPGALALWLFATLNALNGTGYLAYSGAIDYGDWAVVIAPLAPHAAWRAALVVAGLLLYGGTIAWSAALLSRWTRAGAVRREDVPALVLPAYLAGGLLLVAGAALNPIGVQLVLLSGVSAGFAAPAGMLLVPRLVRGADDASAPYGTTLAFAPRWIVAALLAAAWFIGILGRGITFTG